MGKCWETLSDCTKVDTDLVMARGEAGRTFPSFSGCWRAGGFLYSPRSQVGMREETQEQSCWLSSPRSVLRALCHIRAGSASSQPVRGEVQLFRPPSPSSHTPVCSKFTDSDGKMDEDSMSSSPWYFGAIHQSDPYQAALSGTAWVTGICASF